METKATNVELIDKFIENERKSKLWTVLSVGLFLLLASIVLWLAFSLSKTNQKLDITVNQRDSAYKKLDSMFRLLQQDTLSIGRNAAAIERKYDSLKESFDALVIILNKTQAENLNNDTAAAMQQVAKISNEIATAKNVKVIENVKQAVLQPQKNIVASNKVLVFLQYMPGFERQCKELTKALGAYKLEKSEAINDFTFNSAVKYFNDADKAEAEKILGIVNSSSAYFKQNPAKLQKLNMKTTYRQVEIWVGEYAATDAKKFLQQVRQNKFQKAN